MRKIKKLSKHEKIVLIAEYILNTGSSARDTAKYISKKYFPISNVTVSSYCKEYISMYPKKGEQLIKIINAKKVDNIKDKEVEFRVYNHTKLLLSGLTIKEIEKLSGSSYWTIYYDVTRRLEKLDKSLASKVKKVLIFRKNKNINKGN